MALLLLDSTPEGWSFDVLIGLPRHRMMQFQRAGTPIPPPLLVRAVIDTGSDVTCVASRVRAIFGLRRLRRASTTTTAAGQVRVNLYRVSLSISATIGAAPRMLIRQSLIVMELTTPLPGNIEVLVGRDILEDCLFVADGPRRQFTLSW